MSDVVVVGGGPAGLSAALFAAKNGLDTVVFDTDDTSLHYAHLFNYPGIPSIDGDEFVERARVQVADHGADRRSAEVTDIAADGNGFSVTTETGTESASYVVLATGQERTLATELGCELNDDGTVAVDADGATSIDGVYAAGWIARKDKVQAAISVGMGAAAALDILSAEFGEGFHDFDTPDDVD